MCKCVYVHIYVYMCVCVRVCRYIYVLVRSMWSASHILDKSTHRERRVGKRRCLEHVKNQNLTEVQSIVWLTELHKCVFGVSVGGPGG